VLSGSRSCRSDAAVTGSLRRSRTISISGGGGVPGERFTETTWVHHHTHLGNLIRLARLTLRE
jgi:hypothetical protein